MTGEDWAILGIALVGGAGLGWAGYTLTRPSSSSGSPPTSTPTPGQIQTINGLQYIAVKGQYGIAWVRTAAAQLTQTPQGSAYPRQCGTVFMQLGPALPAESGAFGPNATTNVGVAIYVNGQRTSYTFQRPNAASPAPVYGNLSGGTTC